MKHIHATHLWLSSSVRTAWLTWSNIRLEDSRAFRIACASCSLSGWTRIVKLYRLSNSSGYLVNRCNTVGSRSFNCNRRQALCDSALISNCCSLSSFFRRSFSASRAICCRAQKYAACSLRSSPDWPSNCKTNKIKIVQVF